MNRVAAVRLCACLSGMALGAVAMTWSVPGAYAEGASPEAPWRLYLGLGAGVSDLAPRSTTESLGVSDGNGATIELFVGFELTPHVALEAYASDLGEAGIEFLGNDVGDVDYAVAGIDLVGRLPLGGALDERGWNAFASVGIGHLETDAGDLDERTDHDTHAAFGAGVEYRFADSPYTLRAGIKGHDRDARTASVGVMRRFGERTRPARASTPTLAAARPAVVPPPSPPATRAAPSAPTRDPGATLRFAFDSDELDDASRDALVALSMRLAASGCTDRSREPECSLRIDGHADETGSSAYNLALSERRAATTMNYLQGLGIGAHRLETRAFGESSPAAPNDTLEGRALNRRAELMPRREAFARRD